MSDDYVFAEVEHAWCEACQHEMGETTRCENCEESYCPEHLTETEKGWLCDGCVEDAT